MERGLTERTMYGILKHWQENLNFETRLKIVKLLYTGKKQDWYVDLLLEHINAASPVKVVALPISERKYH